MGLYKKCEVCGTNISKLQHWFNIYLLKTGIRLKCPNCGTEYKTNKLISFIGNFYTYSGVSLFVLLGCTVILDKLFKKDFGGEVWLYAFIILSIINFMVMIILPLNKVENKKEEIMNKILINFTTTQDGNLAYHVGDIKENVDKNRENLAVKLGYKNEDLVYMNQVHGNNVVIVDDNSPKLIDNCDGIITNTKNLPLMVMVADCIPILFFDEKIYSSTYSKQ